ncbi:2-oxoacid:acceptor oxidoreductase family protein [Magnetospira sp. QH-2]|uniref:2-oxoacid:acceptor oxidoreductase family protein n=1 Tax=Magnetospira sp. (strain QH-2) TaxID=1288970 RepID=UPI0003E80ADD|nr:2-oxoacid:acceptor oxidoreductase family protein [Magnetospira sp. QH-2]CCQ73648.1 Pyruvate synthase subunit porC [Magnetospira sp. QH-2]
MMEIRIHGRGGQGNVVAAYVLATAAFEDGRFCQAFPAFGAERRGAPVVAFVRVSHSQILQRDEVKTPSFLIIQDETLLHEAGLTKGLKKGGGILINSTLDVKELKKRYKEDMIPIPATQMAIENVGRPVPNVALLSAFLEMTGMLPQSALKKALSQRFKAHVLENNLRLAHQAAKAVDKGMWKEIADAASA